MQGLLRSKKSRVDPNRV